jgi:hypothetical protein
VISRSQIKGILGLTLLLPVALVACHKEEQAVANVAQGAVTAEHKAQAAATEVDKQRDALSHIPLPTKSLYVDVHEPGAWVNPFLSVDADSLDLRVTMADANPSSLGQGTMLRPEADRTAAGRLALWPRDRCCRVTPGEPQGPPQSAPQLGSHHPAAQRPGHCC